MDEVECHWGNGEGRGGAVLPLLWQEPLCRARTHLSAQRVLSNYVSRVLLVSAALWPPLEFREALGTLILTMKVGHLDFGASAQ